MSSLYSPEKQGESSCIRSAYADELAQLSAIEQAAATLFRQTRYAAEISQETLPLEFLQQQQSAGRVWVAVDSRNQPVGFAVAVIIDDLAHLHELSVDPAHGQRGLGKQLMLTVCEWAKNNGYAGITLSTFRDIPWNAPFYARSGFQELKEEELSAGLRQLRAQEEEAGLPVAARVCMRLLFTESDS